MIIKRSLAFIIASAMMAQPVLAEDDPNAAVTAERHGSMPKPRGLTPRPR